MEHHDDPVSRNISRDPVSWRTMTVHAPVHIGSIYIYTHIFSHMCIYFNYTYFRIKYQTLPFWSVLDVRAKFLLMGNTTPFHMNPSFSRISAEGFIDGISNDEFSSSSVSSPMPKS